MHQLTDQHPLLVFVQRRPTGGYHDPGAGEIVEGFGYRSRQSGQHRPQIGVRRHTEEFEESALPPHGFPAGFARGIGRALGQLLGRDGLEARSAGKRAPSQGLGDTHQLLDLAGQLLR